MERMYKSFKTLKTPYLRDELTMKFGIPASELKNLSREELLTLADRETESRKVKRTKSLPKQSEKKGVKTWTVIRRRPDCEEEEITYQIKEN